MKKILLLAAMAAPLAMFAQESTTPTAPAPWQFLQYNLPVGTFYSANGQAGKDPDVLVPAAFRLTWVNTSYYVGDFNTIYPWEAGTFTWKGTDKATTVDGNRVTNANYAPYTCFRQGVAAPKLVATDESLNVPAYQYSGSVFGSSNIADSYYTFNPNGATIDQSELFKFDSTKEYELSQLWLGQELDYPSLNIVGFAQKIDYAGVPYILKSLDLGTLPQGSSCIVSIYEAPADSTMALPEKPIQVFTQGGDDQSSIQGSGALSLDLTTFDDSDIIIDRPIVVVVSQIDGTYEVKSLMEPTAEDKPAVTNKGAYAVAEIEDENGEVSTILLPTTTVNGNDAGIATALDMQVGVAYPFFKPISIVDGGKATDSISFDNTFNAVSIRVATSEMEPANIVVEGVPEWLNVSIAKTTAEDVAICSPKKADKVTPKFTIADAQYVIVTIAANSIVNATADLTFSVPGTSTTFTVSCVDPSGIENVTAPDAAVVAREYYDLSGRRLNAAPVKGFYIEKSIRADGSASSVSRVR